MTKPRYTVSIIIPVWNNWNLTEACLRSLHAHTSGIEYQVVMVDNGSTDQTPGEAPVLGKALFGAHFTYLRLNENQGFAKACNQGAWASEARYLYFLNNDTISTPGWLLPLLEAIKSDSRLAGVGPLLLFPDDGTVRSKRVQHLGITSSYGMDFRHLYEHFPHTHPAVTKRRRLHVITAAALLMPTPLFKAENGFFEGFVNGMEDVDLCCRMADRGGFFSVIPDSVVYHHTHGTEGRFAHEPDNLRLLRERCRHASTDLYDLILADGFEPGFTPWLDLIVRLPKEREMELDRLHFDEPTPERLFTLLEREPLWDAGYVALARRLTVQDRKTEAMSVAYFRSLLCPSLEAFQECEQRMRQCGMHMADNYAVTLRNLQTAMTDQDGLIRKAQTIRQTVRHPAVLAALQERLGG